MDILTEIRSMGTDARAMLTDAERAELAERAERVVPLTTRSAWSLTPSGGE